MDILYMDIQYTRLISWSAVWMVVCFLVEQRCAVLSGVTFPRSVDMVLYRIRLYLRFPAVYLTYIHCAVLYARRGFLATCTVFGNFTWGRLCTEWKLISRDQSAYCNQVLYLELQTDLWIQKRDTLHNPIT